MIVLFQLMYYPYSQHSTGLLDGSEKQSRQTLSKKTTFRDSIVSSTWVDAIVSASQKIKPTTLYAFVSGQSQFCDPVFNVSIPVVWIWIIRTCRQLKYIWIIHQLNHIWMSAHGISSFGVEFSSKKKPVEELWVSKAIKLHQNCNKNNSNKGMHKNGYRMLIFL